MGIEKLDITPIHLLTEETLDNVAAVSLDEEHVGVGIKVRNFPSDWDGIGIAVIPGTYHEVEEWLLAEIDAIVPNGFDLEEFWEMFEAIKGMIGLETMQVAGVELLHNPDNIIGYDIARNKIYLENEQTEKVEPISCNIPLGYQFYVSWTRNTNNPVMTVDESVPDAFWDYLESVESLLATGIVAISLVDPDELPPNNYIVAFSREASTITVHETGLKLGPKDLYEGDAIINSDLDFKTKVYSMIYQELDEEAPAFTRKSLEMIEYIPFRTFPYWKDTQKLVHKYPDGTDIYGDPPVYPEEYTTYDINSKITVLNYTTGGGWLVVSGWRRIRGRVLYTAPVLVAIRSLMEQYIGIGSIVGPGSLTPEPDST